MSARAQSSTIGSALAGMACRAMRCLRTTAYGMSIKAALTRSASADTSARAACRARCRRFRRRVSSTGQSAAPAGGEHHGAADMITEVWAGSRPVYEMRVEPHDYLHVDDERVVVLAGTGTRPATAVRPWTPSSPTSSPRAVARSQRCNRSPTPPGRA